MSATSSRKSRSRTRNGETQPQSRSRLVSSLSPASLTRKRELDRHNQRAIRIRTKTLIKDLESEVKFLRSFIYKRDLSSDLDEFRAQELNLMMAATQTRTKGYTSTSANVSALQYSGGQTRSLSDRSEFQLSMTDDIVFDFPYTYTTISSNNNNRGTINASEFDPPLQPFEGMISSSCQDQSQELFNGKLNFNTQSLALFDVAPTLATATGRLLPIDL